MHVFSLRSDRSCQKRNGKGDNIPWWDQWMKGSLNKNSNFFVVVVVTSRKTQFTLFLHKLPKTKFHFKESCRKLETSMLNTT